MIMGDSAVRIKFHNAHDHYVRHDAVFYREEEEVTLFADGRVEVVLRKYSSLNENKYSLLHEAKAEGKISLEDQENERSLVEFVTPLQFFDHDKLYDKAVVDHRAKTIVFAYREVHKEFQVAVVSDSRVILRILTEIFNEFAPQVYAWTDFYRVPKLRAWLETKTPWIRERFI